MSSLLLSTDSKCRKPKRMNYQTPASLRGRFIRQSIFDYSFDRRRYRTLPTSKPINVIITEPKLTFELNEMKWILSPLYFRAARSLSEGWREQLESLELLTPRKQPSSLKPSTSRWWPLDTEFELFCRRAALSGQKRATFQRLLNVLFGLLCTERSFFSEQRRSEFPRWLSPRLPTAVYCLRAKRWKNEGTIQFGDEIALIRVYPLRWRWSCRIFG